MNFLSLMQNRYTTKYYDPNKKISKDDIDSLLECLRLTPSSVNCQPWHFYAPIPQVQVHKWVYLPGIAVPPSERQRQRKSR